MYFDLPRLSVDLDFNFTGAIAKKDMEKRRPALEKKIENILQFKGYKFEVDASAYGSTKISVKYINNAGNADKIKIDINYLLRVSISPNILKGFTATFESTVEKVNTLLAEELFGEKLLALMSRKAPRDLYDVYNLVNSTINLDLSALRKIFIFLGCVGRKDFREYSPNDILSITSMDLKTGLYPFLRKGDRPSIEDLFKVTAPFLESLFRFDKQENRFIRDFFNGTPNIELLFSDFKNVSNLISHPMLIWKQKHLKEFLAKKT